MGSVKDLVIAPNELGGRFYHQPTLDAFGNGTWKVSGRFSVGDLKKLIPDTTIENKAEALTMATARFFEWLAKEHPEIPTCYEGVLARDGWITDTATLLDKGETTNLIVMKLAHVPETYLADLQLTDAQKLKTYREAMASGQLQCGVADIESIFRKGLPLGSSVFEKIFKAVGMGREYETLATYDETVAGLDKVRALVQEKGLDSFSGLEKLLKDTGLGTTIPNPGFVLKNFTYNSTTKFEEAGDRDVTKEEERRLSGLSDSGYELWTQEMFPNLARAQIKFCSERDIFNIDGKAECVAYRRMPVVADFACTPDENRLMIKVVIDGVEWAIPSNKEIQRAIFRKEGVYAAINEAKRAAEKDGDKDKWKDYLPAILQDRKIDLRAVSEHSCNLMAYAVAEVANRTLGKRVFDAKPLEFWARDFLPYASRVQIEV